MSGVWNGDFYDVFGDALVTYARFARSVAFSCAAGTVTKRAEAPKLVAEKLSIIVRREMNRDRLAIGTQWPRGSTVDGELNARGITNAKDDVFVRLDLNALPSVQQAIDHLSMVRCSAEPTHSARLNIQPQLSRSFIN